MGCHFKWQTYKTDKKMEQATEYLIDDFRLGKKEFNRLFLIGLFFALACHFYVVEPYFLFKQQEASLNISRATIQQSVHELSIQENKLVTTKKNVHDGLDSVQKKITSFPNHLRKSLPNIRDALRNSPSNEQIDQDIPVYQDMQYIQQQAPVISTPSIIIPAHITKFPQAVSWYIDEWFKKLMTDLDQTVVSPLMDLAQREKITGAEQLKELSQEAVQQVHTHISGIDPNFWRSYGGAGGKLDVAGQIRRNIEQAFHPLETKVKQVLTQTKNLRQQQSDQLKKHEEKLSITKKQITELADRLKTLESPFGRIPLGLIDLIKIFPFILAAIAITLTARLNQSIRLRSLIQEIHSHDHLKLSESLQEYQLGGWLFPATSRKQPFILLAAWFIIVIFLSCRAAWLVGWTSRLFETPAAHIFINQSIYKSCYTAVLILMIVTAIKGLKNLYQT